MLLESSQAKSKSTQDKKDTKGNAKVKGFMKDNLAQKFEQYFNFRMHVKLLKSYQVIPLSFWMIALMHFKMMSKSTQDKKRYKRER